LSNLDAVAQRPLIMSWTNCQTA